MYFCKTILISLLSIVAFGVMASGKVEFSADVRPILSRTCFQCHGADESSRKAKLRLDIRAEATKPRKGITPLFPGQLTRSEAWRRIVSHDPEEQMPPPESKIALTKPEIEILGKWIKQGAAYTKHWSFEPMKLPPVPKLNRGAIARNPIDHFVTAKLAEHHLKQNSEADRNTLIRRLSLDIIGLPPTREEVAAFINDKSPDAFDQVVDRLLASPHYGEKWAREWLDLARYADSSGYGSDELRLNMWPYRDWVINALNKNMTYEEFTLEQLAGDLLTAPTMHQRIATTFHRNTMSNMEGGTDDEEYRVAAVKDRVNTTMQVWMGLTAGCAQCHTHKFDPITQKEYYQLFAIFNQTEDADKPDEAPLMPVPVKEEEAAHWETLQSEITGLEKKLHVSTPEFEKELSDWSMKAIEPVKWEPLSLVEGSSKNGSLSVVPDGSLKAGTNIAASETFTAQFKTTLKAVTAFRLETLPDQDAKGEASLTSFEISVKPAGSQTTLGRFVRVENAAGQFIHLAEVEVFSGGTNVARQGKARQSTTGYGGEAARAIDGNTSGDYEKNSVSHTADGDPNPFWEVDLGAEIPLEKIVLWNRTDGNGERIVGARLLVLDQGRQTVYSENIVTPPKPSLEVVLSGWSRVALKSASADVVTPGNGPEHAIEAKRDSGWHVALDAPHAAVFELEKPLTVGDETLLTITLHQTEKGRHPLTNFRITATTRTGPVCELPPAIRAVLLVEPAHRTAQQAAELADYFWPRAMAYEPLKKTIADKRADFAKIKTVSVPVMKEMLQDRRVSHILAKGNYLTPTEEVQPAVLASFNSGPTNHADRLALVQWLMAADNPLTARVTVNRFWAQLFGLGIVETEEDFGTQGSQPFNPELLDWLAVTFRTPKSQGGLGWDIKALIRLIVSSQSYRQSSVASEAAKRIDPRNQFVSHYPRRRLEAEAIRDQALALAGLLSPRLGGPSVYPPQPDGLWVVAFRGKENYPTSTGEDRWRRSLYTIWRRIAPNPGMTAFDAPSREGCTLRRLPSNTPLQSFVTLNDPVYVEAAQAFARRILREAKGGAREKIKWAVESVLARPATETQIAALNKLLEKTSAELRANPDRANLLATSPELPPPLDADVVELAAWTALANVLLNLDAVLVNS